MSARQYRILVTGSRDWQDVYAVGKALHGAARTLIPNIDDTGGWPRITVVHGDARGLDRIAASTAIQWGMPVEAHPADWERRGKAAGPERNARMVALGADLCLAFPLGESRGTRDCMRRAETAGIPVRLVAPPGEAS